ncbi:hypothetical protein PsAD2_01108 [Pseudovibrio axinellae]|uniref:DUF6985 domain-containing protein n=1 Tax=Pseudovibrio axinellae TaxID=989403 RepID=A0A166A4T4_9HYPH|nr:hypothetical protein [Pseudovibrio axinellae]KZL20622.1 hypothetical protein PsAD2_01108 [Pseudovibrio axinellae]SER27625.1 hypothetical protein SAMN05421798_107269 [Pseudovibrio axinellae]
MTKILKLENSNFYSKLISTISEDFDRQAQIEKFICKSWEIHYDLFNPENFEDPEDHELSKNNPDYFEELEIPHTNAAILDVFGHNRQKDYDVTTLQDLIKHTALIEERILDFFIHYTFGDGGAYAEGKHYRYAQTTIEDHYKTSFTQKEFVRRLLRLQTIILPSAIDGLKLEFMCAWDMEHGVVLEFKDGSMVESEI